MKDKESFQRWQSVAKKILRYLAQHPEAMDTADGILNWWLGAGHARISNEEAEEILDIMVKKGWIVARKASPSPTIYGANPQSGDAIKAFLVELPDSIE